MTDAKLTREEWVHRYAARIVDVAALDTKEATKLAEIGHACMDQDLQTHGDTFYSETPEAAADEEMSYWENDE